MKILIIGSKGFIGSHCVDYFSHSNEVWECDVVMDYDNHRYISIDSVDSDFFEIFQNNQFDVCINCSGSANVPFSLQKPYNDFRLNTLNVLKVLEAIRLYNIECKLITMSSAAVYGNPKSLPIKVDVDRNPVSPYGYHKTITEILCEEFNRFWGLKTCSLRIFSAFGPGLRKQLFWDLYNKFVGQDIINLWGTGKESRDFIYIDDLVRIIDLTIQHSDFNASVINAANGVQISIEEVVNMFLNVLNSNKIVAFNNEERKGDPKNWEADVDVIKSWGYAPSYTIQAGIKEYIDWIRKDK